MVKGFIQNYQHHNSQNLGPEKIHGGMVAPDYLRIDHNNGDVDIVPTSVLLGTIV